jgi:hypothetical protein
MIADVIRFVLSNFPLTFLILGLVLALIRIFRHEQRGTARIVDALFAYFLLCSIGLSFLYNFVMHVFFGSMAAAFIGWAPSPFQYEVGYASLGFAVLGLMAFWRSLSFRAASVIGPTIFLWGAASGHIYQMITAHNFAPGNAGIIFWMDILIPIIGLALLFLQSRHPVTGGDA